MKLNDSLFFVALFLGMMLFCFYGCGPRVVVKPAPDDMEEDLFLKAERSFSAGKYETALTQYKAYVELHPDSPLAPGALMKMGRIYTSREIMEMPEIDMNELLKNILIRYLFRMRV